MFWKLWKPTMRKHPESGLTGNRGFLRKVCQPHLRNKPGEKMSIVVGKPLHLRQKPISISPWESKHGTEKQLSTHSNTGDLMLENPSSAPDPDQILTVVHQGC